MSLCTGLRCILKMESMDSSVPKIDTTIPTLIKTYLNPNPGARKAYLTRNRVRNNVVATPGFDPRTSRAPAPDPTGQATVCRCPASVFLHI